MKKEGSVTIPLDEYNRLLGLEQKLERFKKEPDTILIYAGSYYDESWWVVRPGEAVEHIANKQNAEITRLQKELEKYTQSKCLIVEHQCNRKKWYQF